MLAPQWSKPPSSLLLLLRWLPNKKEFAHFSLKISFHPASPWSMVVFLFCLAVGRVGWILTKSTGDLTMCRIPTKPTTPNIGLNRKRLSISYDVEEKNIAGSFAPQSCPIHVALQFLCEESCSCTGGYKPEVTNISNSRLRECEMQSCGRQCCTALKLLCKHSISKVQAPECKHNSANNRVQLESKWCRPTEAKLSLFVCPSMNNRRWQTARKKSKLLTAQVLQPIN